MKSTVKLFVLFLFSAILFSCNDSNSPDYTNPSILKGTKWKCVKTEVVPPDDSEYVYIEIRFTSTTASEFWYLTTKMSSAQLAGNLNYTIAGTDIHFYDSTGSMNGIIGTNKITVTTAEGSTMEFFKE